MTQQHARPVHAFISGHVRCAGFTYLALLVALSVMALTSAMTVQLGARFQRAAAERELLAAGMAYRAALISYANATPAGMRRRPAALEDLLKDPRYPSTRRHLRRLYADPMTGKATWGLVQAGDGSGVAGVHSLCDERTAAQGHAGGDPAGLAYPQSYRDWKFMGAP